MEQTSESVHNVSDADLFFQIRKIDPMATIIDGKAVAAARRAALRTKVDAFYEKTGVRPHLAAVLVGDDPASAVYVRNKQRACEKAGIESTLFRKPAELSESELLDLVGELNEDSAIHGTLVQVPLPKQIDEQRILDAVRPLKDVDCFHVENVGLMVQGRPRFLPCTPSGCMVLLDEAGISTSGKHAVVLGRSEIVGKPMAALLMQKGADATVTVCHSRTADLAAITRQADIVIAAIGRPKFLTADMVKEGVAVIDVGVNRLDDGSLCGDVDFQGVEPLASAITPVPGGVGPMTIAMLLENTLKAAEIQVEV